VYYKVTFEYFRVAVEKEYILHIPNVSL